MACLLHSEQFATGGGVPEARGSIVACGGDDATVGAEARAVISVLFAEVSSAPLSLLSSLSPL
ncbi:MAG: hypothetical protein WDO68_31320 [Gammaproteobacteria bacterium]